MFSKLTLHQALFLLSKFSKLSSTKIRERLLLFPDPKQVICDVFKNNHNKYRSVFNLKPVTKTECFEALKLFGRQQQMGIKAISYLDKESPFNLEKIADAPILIYRKLYPSQIIQLSGLDKSTVLELLLKMNLENQISQNPDNSYSV